VVKSVRSLKTCKKCGHYKDYGYFKDNHSNTEFYVLERHCVIGKCKGYCAYEICVLTALLQGKDKPPKLRKLYKDTSSIGRVLAFNTYLSLNSPIEKQFLNK
jgi:hypothetical protein